MDESHVTASATAVNDQIGLLNIAIVLAENLRMIVVVPAVAGLAALGMTFLLTPTYTAVTRILPPQQQQSATANMLASQLGSLAGVMGNAAGIKNPADTYVAMIKSRTVADKLVARFKLQQVYEEKYDEDARNQLSNLTNVTTGRGGLILIEVDDHDAKRAAEIANAYVEELYELTQRLAVGEAAQRRLFFQNQLKQAKNDLTKAELALRGSGISEATLKTVPQSALDALSRLKAQVTAQEVKLGAMRGFMTESNPEFRQARQELAALRSELAKAEQVDPVKAGGAGAEYIARFRDFKYHETLFELMAKQYEMARLDEARDGAVIQVVDSAVPPEKKSRPKRTLVAILTTLIAFWAVVLVVLLRQGLRKAASQPESAERLRRLKRVLRFRRV